MSDILRDFDKKNEIPKVKIPKFATGGICNDVIFPKLDAFSQVDEIVKDIRDRQDNAMAMEFTKCIGELLRKNGVVPKISEYRIENHAENHTENKIEMRYGVNIDELDFSEHDKVFEDKIAKLEKELEEWKEEARVVKKQRDEQLKSFRKGIEPYVDLLHMHETIAELKQHIDELKSKNESLNQSINEITTSRSEWIDRAVEWQQKCEKLESKETEKPRKINLNDRIKVKLTPLGAEIYYHMFDDTNKKAKKTIIEPHLPKVDEKGYTEFTLWGFINIYGQYIDVGKPNVIDPIDIIACE